MIDPSHQELSKFFWDSIARESKTQEQIRNLEFEAMQHDSDKETIKRLRSERDGWKQSAKEFSNNQEFYYNIIQSLGPILGEDVYTSDDGSIQQDVLALKVEKEVQSLKNYLINTEKSLVISQNEHNKYAEAFLKAYDYIHLNHMGKTYFEQHIINSKKEFERICEELGFNNAFI